MIKVTHHSTWKGERYTEGLYRLDNGRPSCARFDGHLSQHEFLYKLAMFRSRCGVFK